MDVTVVNTVTILEVVGITVGVIVGVGGLVSMIWAVGRVKGIETTLTLLTTANDALRDALADERTARADDKADLTRKLAEQERQCATEIAMLRGQVDTLTGGLADRIVDLVREILEDIRLKENQQ